MAEVLPFRAWRYNPALADPALVTAPPYDVIDRKGQEFYHLRHPENIIRLILGREEPGDDEVQNKYMRARFTLDQWRRRKVLIQDPEPAFYLYRQDFMLPGRGNAARTGLIADLTLTPFGEGVVLPHEHTLAKPKEDRLKLMRATGFQLSQIFMLYEDPRSELRQMLMERSEKPLADLVDPEEVRHRLWAVTDGDSVARIQSFFAARPVYIADGHHRYETALAYRDERIAQGLPVGAAATIACVFVDMADPGLIVHPTHRAVHSLPDWTPEKFRAALGRFFDLTPFTGGAEALAAAIADRPHSFGFFFGNEAVLAALRDEREALAAMPAERDAVWKRLDVSILHALVFGEILRISAEAQAKQENLIYSRDPNEVARMVADGRVQFGVLLRPTSVWELKDVADVRENMPQKSTYFWPKLLSGLILKEM